MALKASILKHEKKFQNKLKNKELWNFNINKGRKSN